MANPQNETTPGAPPEEKATGLPFHQAALAKFRATAADVLASHPEVRSAVVVLDYRGGLNDAKIDKAIWLGENGPVTEPAAIFGSIFNTLATLEFLFTRAAQTEQAMVQRVQALYTEIAKRQQHLDQLNQAIAAAEETAPGHDGQAGPHLPAGPGGLRTQEREPQNGQFAGFYDPGAPPARHRRLVNHETHIPKSNDTADLLDDIQQQEELERLRRGDAPRSPEEAGSGEVGPAAGG